MIFQDSFETWPTLLRTEYRAKRPGTNRIGVVGTVICSIGKFSWIQSDHFRQPYILGKVRIPVVILPVFSGRRCYLRSIAEPVNLAARRAHDGVQGLRYLIIRITMGTEDTGDIQADPAKGGGRFDGTATCLPVECPIPLLNARNGLIVDRPGNPTIVVGRSTASLELIELTSRRDHPRMLEQLSCRDSQIAILLEALDEKISNDG